MTEVKALDRWPLLRLLDAVDRSVAQREEVTVRDVFSELGNRAITPLILLVSLLLVSPISSVPGVPTTAAILIILLAGQALIGRRSLWLPDVLMRLRLSADLVSKAVGWLRRPAGWIDRHARPRLTVLTRGPARFAVLCICVLVPVTWPALELLPGVTSLAAAGISLFAFGLLARDGFYVLAGFFIVALMAAGAGLVLIAVGS